MNPSTTLSTPMVKPAYSPSPLVSLGRALSAELLKMKRTLALWLTVLTPAVIAALVLLMVLQKGEQMFTIGKNPWMFITRQMFMFWTLLMQPLFITLETALVAQLDHTNDHWKHIFALPLPRWTIYLAKLMVSILLIGLSLIVLFGYTLVAGEILRVVRPQFGFDASIPWLQMLPMAGVAFLTSWLIIAIHHFVALNWRSFVIASGFGIIMTVAGVLIVNSDEGNILYPWTMAAVATLSLTNDVVINLPAIIAYGVLGGLAVAVTGCGWFTHKDVL